MALILPNDTQRVTVIGKTGSGKTQAGAWLLSLRSYDRRPWIIFDFKGDDLLNAIPHTRELGVRDKPPRHPGLYVVRPNALDGAAVEAMLWAVWERERIGVYVDEGYMIDKGSPGFQALLTQGRSKRIPVITLTQRPVSLSRFAFSEADFIMMFQLTDRRDRKTVAEFCPLPVESPLPGKYHSWWWDNGADRRAILKPVPDRNTILATFYERLKQPRRVI